MKILPSARNGRLGWELQRGLAPLGELLALGSQGEAWPIDFREPDRSAETVRQLRPCMIVSVAAYTMVDKAESDEGAALLVNASASSVPARGGAGLRQLDKLMTSSVDRFS
jgi:dTDP-4-dehydrorhamnose reductase